MLKISTIKNGVVIDHIEAGLGIKIFNKLELGKSDLNVALIMNVESKTMDKKDIIKIEGNKEIDYRILVMISKDITINEVENEKIVNKVKPKLPNEVIGVLQCDNSNCITKYEKYVPHKFTLVNSDRKEYKCEYCDHIISL